MSFTRSGLARVDEALDVLADDAPLEALARASHLGRVDRGTDRHLQRAALHLAAAAERQ